ncbi:MAG: hypothetical protein ACR2NB_14030, partial [Solirubrobacteraceae bacterium]
MSWIWIASDEQAGLAVWPGDGGDPPAPGALRADARIADPDGASCEVSLVLVPDGVRIPMDDLAVQQARRAILAGRPFDAVSVLLSDASRFEGSLVAARGEQIGRLADDPFARRLPARRLRVAAGVLGTVPPPAGPTIERYGSANPWPW